MTYSFVSVALSVTLLNNVMNNVNGMKVAVYYEALCGDSVDFITHQLYPHFSELSDYIDLELIPYGKAVHNYNNGSYEFSCQHGPSECKGNKLQSCILAHNDDQLKQVQFVNCIMRRRSRSSSSTVKGCARQYHLDVENFDSCSKGSEGDRLLAGMGDKTLALDPSISFVPTIIFDGKYNEDVQNDSLVDFVAVVCSKIGGTKPSICENRHLPRRLWN
ncbi:GILT-like protein 1 isoform X2 [Leptinotarsa decemlineata]|uniref:GILT-like protein 1 isoform X2 n=1 Tax=Leptinotarsa decemlineata TaxID=7539 RepID=UPI003D30979B